LRPFPACASGRADVVSHACFEVVRCLYSASISGTLVSVGAPEPIGENLFYWSAMLMRRHQSGRWFCRVGSVWRNHVVTGQISPDDQILQHHPDRPGRGSPVPTQTNTQTLGHRPQPPQHDQRTNRATRSPVASPPYTGTRNARQQERVTMPEPHRGTHRP
jgi:hypothetical protein